MLEGEGLTHLKCKCSRTNSTNVLKLFLRCQNGTVSLRVERMIPNSGR